MALNSTKTCNNAINPFHKFSTKIALELLTRDVKVLKHLTLDKVPGGVLESIKAEEEYSGLNWFLCLTKHEVICEYNVKFLIEALEAANRHDLAKKAKEYQDQIVGEREELDRTETRLISKSIFYTTRDCVHLFFAVEMGYAAGGTHMCKGMINASQKALNTCCKEPLLSHNIELALIKFGNHHTKRNTNSSAPRGQESDVAVLVKEMSKNLSMCSCPTLYSLCGGRGGTSGIADALAKFVDYVQRNEMQRQIPKICILICFISKECSDLEYFRCPEGKDAIKLCNTLAECAIPLYIIGIDHAGVQACARGTPHVTEENPFLSGITFIGGGQYFQVSDMNHVEQAINCIIKENISIEEHMGTVDDIVIIERNKEGGNLNVEHLAEHLRENLNLRSCTVDNIKLNNESPQAISQIVQRVAWADDLNDAINAVKSWREQNESLDRTRSIDFSLSRGSRSFSNYSAVSQYSCESFSSLPTSEMQAQNQQTLFPELKPNSASSMSRSIFSSGHTSTSGGESASFQSLFSSTTTQNLQTHQPMEPSLKPSTRRRKRKAEHTTTTQNKRRNDSESTKNNSSFLTLAERQRVGMDVARRMVRRQITRQAYYQRIK